MNCIFQCDQIETQDHVFQNCNPILRRLSLDRREQMTSIYGSPSEQKNAIQVFAQIHQMRKHMIDNLPPGEAIARTQSNIICNKL